MAAAQKWQPTEDKVMDADEIKALRDSLERRALADIKHGRATGVVRWAVVDVALTAGLRVAEIAALKVQDVHLTGRQPNLTVRHGKGDRKRVIPLSGPLSGLREHLKELLEWKGIVGQPTDANEPLFATTLRGRWKHYTPDALQNSFKIALEHAGISMEKYSIHCARHTAATFLYKRTKNLRLVQKILGHSSPSVTAHYAAIVNGWEALDEAEEAGLYDEDT